MTQPISEMQFSREYRPTELSVATFRDGTVQFTLSAHGKMRAYPATLGQTIQLRDFLNRHIDGLALQQIGSLAVRASDDPAQLASVEEVPTRPSIEVRLPSINGQEYDPLAVADFRAQCVEMLGQQGVAVEVDAGVLAFEESMQRPPAGSEKD